MLRTTSAVLLLIATPALAAPGGRPQLNAYFQQTLTDAKYQQKVFTKVSRAWRQPPASKAPPLGSKTVVAAVIAADGKLVSAEITMKSGSEAWDRAALAAVKKAAPFGPLPKGFALPTVEAHFHVSWQR